MHLSELHLFWLQAVIPLAGPVICALWYCSVLVSAQLSQELKAFHMFFVTVSSADFNRSIFMGIQLCDQSYSPSGDSFIPASCSFTITLQPTSHLLPNNSVCVCT